MTRVAVLAALGLIAATAGCGERPSQGPAAAAPKPEARAADSPKPTAVTTVAPEYRTRHSALETSGKVTFNEEGLVRINATVTGRVLEVLAKPGDVAEPGHRLLVVDSPDLGLAKSDYAKAVADVERSEAALKLARELFEVRAIAANEIRDAESEYRRTTAERDHASSRLRTLGVRTDQFADIAARKDASTTLVIAAPRGGVSLLDYLDAQRTYRETALEHIRTVGAYWSAVYQLEAAVGGSLRAATEGGSLR